MNDCIYRQEAVDALWKALWKYEDESEQAFQTHEELDIADWFQHRIFVQRMSDIDRDTIIDMPSADVEPVVRCKDCKYYQFALDRAFGLPVKRCEITGFEDVEDNDFCSRGARRDGKHDG